MKLRNKFLVLAVSALFAFSVVPSDAVGGTPSSSSSSSSSRSSSSYSSSSSSGFSKPSSSSSSGSSSFGFSKPSTPSAPQAATTTSSSGFSKPSVSSPSASSATTSGSFFSKPGAGSSASYASKPATQDAMSMANTKAVSNNTLAAYKAERTRATQPPMPVGQAQVKNNPVYTSASKSFGGSVDTYYAQRNVAYTTYSTRYPNVMVITYNMHPNYGIYDSGFLTGMMFGYIGSSMENNARWMYAQQSQPWYPQYRADLERQAATNAELRAKLDAMDAQMAQLKAQGVQPVNANTLPQGVDPAIAIAPEAVIADAPEKDDGWGVGFLFLLVFCGGIVAFVLVKIIRS